MSVAWQNPLVLWREPWMAVARRIVGRAVSPIVAFGLAGVPGSPWAGLLPWTWLRVVVWVIGALALVLWLLAVANVFTRRRIRLVRMPTGSLERPPSIQERMLGSQREFVAGRDIDVSVEYAPLGNQPSDPRVTLRGRGEGGGVISRMPLHGADPDRWVAQMNSLLEGTSVLHLAPPEPVADTSNGIADAPGDFDV